MKTPTDTERLDFLGSNVHRYSKDVWLWLKRSIERGEENKDKITARKRVDAAMRMDEE